MDGRCCKLKLCDDLPSLDRVNTIFAYNCFEPRKIKIKSKVKVEANTKNGSQKWIYDRETWTRKMKKKKKIPYDRKSPQTKKVNQEICSFEQDDSRQC